MAKIREIMIVCGEPSGDLNASELAKKLLEINPKLKITGVGGTLLRKVASQIYCDIKELACFGIFDALKKLPRFLALQKLLLKKIR
jgi:lipid A disaccharide synthetase